MNSRNYPDLYQFLACYFHQDWDLDSATWQGAVLQFVQEFSSEDVCAARKQLDRLLDCDLNETELSKTLLHELGCYYDPTPDGMSFTDWLRLIREQLSDAETDSQGGTG